MNIKVNKELYTLLFTLFSHLYQNPGDCGKAIAYICTQILKEFLQEPGDFLDTINKFILALGNEFISDLALLMIEV